jgi:hypothetical protein
MIHYGKKKELKGHGGTPLSPNPEIKEKEGDSSTLFGAFRVAERFAVKYAVSGVCRA